MEKERPLLLSPLFIHLTAADEPPQVLISMTMASPHFCTHRERMKLGHGKVFFSHSYSIKPTREPHQTSCVCGQAMPTHHHHHHQRYTLIWSAAHTKKDTPYPAFPRHVTAYTDTQAYVRNPSSISAPSSSSFCGRLNAAAFSLSPLSESRPAERCAKMRRVDCGGLPKGGRRK